MSDSEEARNRQELLPNGASEEPQEDRHCGDTDTKPVLDEQQGDLDQVTDIVLENSDTLGRWEPT